MVVRFYFKFYAESNLSFKSWQPLLGWRYLEFRQQQHFYIGLWQNGIQDTRASSVEADYQGTGIPVVGHLVGTISFEVLDVQPGGHGIIYYNGYLPYSL